MSRREQRSQLHVRRDDAQIASKAAAAITQSAPAVLSTAAATAKCKYYRPAVAGSTAAAASTAMLVSNTSPLSDDASGDTELGMVSIVGYCCTCG
jgi:hypothetical protein